MKNSKYALAGVLLVLLIPFISQAQEGKTVVFSGRVTDFEGHPKAGAAVELFKADFSGSDEYLTGEDGHFTIEIPAGKYMAVASMIMDEYPKFSTLPLQEQRLEFWAWNVLLQEDLHMDIRYHRLEVYGVNVWRVEGAEPGYHIYCRPMALTRFQAGLGDRLAPEPEELEVKIWINDEPMPVKMKQKIREYTHDTADLYGYLLYTNRESSDSGKPYDVFRIEMTDTVTGDRGEAVYMREKPFYMQ